MFDSALQRQIMGRFATGVTLVTARSDEKILGMTANAVLSLSLDPPLILVSVNKKNQMRKFLKKSNCFAINVLRDDQEEISRRFATPGPKDFSDLELVESKTGSPVLVNALAFIDCQIVQVVPGGDHDMFIGKPLAGETRDGNPLIFYSGQYTQLIS
ncbi:TPA: flavin reductase [Candidatus Poribacteria bacterium]|nr:flavin reductase [Candidatus Poribacteria bacterium]HIB90058.1 flavin reductase [Candidatus Poribacteria bacterium]HIB98106.1 flavin reductase [Candidatus Poribacteria bacterium]HIN27906.1 flavin reductase [Candidatus Poribacteria bacterium]HIO08598.1 flavin reductase [Candidatus Poribacteria bacterium]